MPHLPDWTCEPRPGWRARARQAWCWIRTRHDFLPAPHPHAWACGCGAIVTHLDVHRLDARATFYVGHQTQRTWEHNHRLP